MNKHTNNSYKMLLLISAIQCSMLFVFNQLECTESEFEKELRKDVDNIFLTKEKSIQQEIEKMDKNIESEAIQDMHSKLTITLNEMKSCIDLNKIDEYFTKTEQKMSTYISKKEFIK